MAALTAADWTIVLDGQPGIVSGHPARRRATGTMAIPGVSTYPTGGIPLPTFDKFGFVRQLEKLELFGQDGAPVIGFTPLTTGGAVPTALQLFESLRSEERRVGKECRL